MKKNCASNWLFTRIGQFIVWFTIV